MPWVTVCGRSLVLGFALLAAGCAGAAAREGGAPEPQAEPVVARPSPCDREESGDEILFDEATQWLADTMCNAARWLDGLFAAPGQIPAGYTTQGSLEVSAFHSEFYGTDVDVRLNARVRLPALERRVSAFVGRADDDDYARDRSEGFGLRSLFSAIDDSFDWFAGLAYDFDIAENVHSDSRVGVRSVSSPQLFAQQRILFDLYSDRVHRVRLRTTPFWNTRDGFGFTSGFDASRALTPRLLLHSGSVGTISEETQGVDWRTAIILYQNLGERHALAYELFVRGATEQPEPLTEYGGLVVYRRPFWRERIYALFQVGYSWPRTDPAAPRDGALGFGAGVEIPLDREADD